MEFHPHAPAALATLTKKNQEPPVQPKQPAPAAMPIWPLNTVKYTQQLLGGVGVSTVYAFVGADQLKVKKLGKNMTRITGESIVALIESLPTGVVEGPAPEGPKYRKTKLGSQEKPGACLEENSSDAA
jgi:hypothetical protein